jgi:hypothetical protein
VGCGVGAWAQAFLANGFPDVIGVDGDYMCAARLPRCGGPAHTTSFSNLLIQPEQNASSYNCGYLHHKSSRDS